MTKPLSNINFDQFTSIAKSFSCDACKTKGNSLIEDKARGCFYCKVCKNERPLTFWHKRFLKLDDTPLTFTQASRIIGAGSSGSTLRRALQEGRLETCGRLGKKESLISPTQLITFYLTSFKHRTKKASASNGAVKE